ncbi:MAG TPA: Chromate resistance protein ChrB [Chthonomonadaceae bacterium]|nr:Chromate resistance protein ChrB [Chthonomonadaceae bacterium]
MADLPNDWTLLVYKIPAHPTRLRLQIWRKLQRMGALYLQNAVCLLPARPDLVENMHYMAAAIEEMGGTCHLFAASALLPGEAQRLAQEFRALADSNLEEIIGRLEKIGAELEAAASPAALERAEEELKRERIAYLRARRLAYFGSTREAEVDARLEALKRALDEHYRTEK